MVHTVLVPEIITAAEWRPAPCLCAGADAFVEFAHYSTLEECCADLRDSKGCEIVGIEIVEGAKAVHSFPFKGNTAFMLGNEVRSSASSGTINGSQTRLQPASRGCHGSKSIDCISFQMHVLSCLTSCSCQPRQTEGPLQPTHSAITPDSPPA